MPPDANLASIAKIATHADVYPPAEDSFLLVDALADVWRSTLEAASRALSPIPAPLEAFPTPHARPVRSS